jgi:hypothetical protein
MLEAIMSTIKTMGWLGIVLGLLVFVNTVCGTIHNVSEGEEFSWKKMFKGIGKAFVFYASSALTAIAFTMLPFINDMITNSFGVILLSPEVLNLLSSVAVLGIVIAATIVQGKKALQGIVELANTSITKDEIITWEVEDPEEEYKPEEK